MKKYVWLLAAAVSLVPLLGWAEADGDRPQQAPFMHHEMGDRDGVQGGHAQQCPGMNMGMMCGQERRGGMPGNGVAPCGRQMGPDPIMMPLMAGPVQQMGPAMKPWQKPGACGGGHHKKCCGAFLGILAIVHLLLGVWVYKDIRKRNSGAGVWIVVTLLTGLLGAAVYALVRLGDIRASINT